MVLGPFAGTKEPVLREGVGTSAAGPKPGTSRKFKLFPVRRMEVKSCFFGPNKAEVYWNNYS
jgi:hypothetical protein